MACARAQRARARSVTRFAAIVTILASVIDRWPQIQRLVRRMIRHDHTKTFPLIVALQITIARAIVSGLAPTHDPCV